MKSAQLKDTTKTPAHVRATRAPRKPRVKGNTCVCGCGTPCHKLFAAGHDQRVRGWMLRGEKLPATLTKAITQGLIKDVKKADAHVQLFAKLPFVPSKAKVAPKVTKKAA